MAKFKYHTNKGFTAATYNDIDPENVDTVGEGNNAVVVLSDDDGVRAVIHLAPGDYIERIND
jgi:hypothetical protein